MHSTIGSGTFSRRTQNWYPNFSLQLPVLSKLQASVFPPLRSLLARLTFGLVLLITLFITPQTTLGQDNRMYGINSSSPARIYEVNPATGSMSRKGTLAFATYAIAVHPQTGEVYYVENRSPYRVAKWNPSTNSGAIINSGTGIALTPRLGFSTDGHLYATRLSTNKLYEINTTNGNPTLVGTISGPDLFANSGDLVMDGNDAMFIVMNSYLYHLNITTMTAAQVGNTGISSLAGLAWGSDGHLIASSISSGNKLVELNTSNGSVLSSVNASTAMYDLGGSHSEHDDCEDEHDHHHGEHDDDEHDDDEHDDHEDDCHHYPNITIVKSVSGDSLTIGSNATYTITVVNTGEGDGNITSLQDSLPASFTYVNGSSVGISAADPVINTNNRLLWQGTWTIGPNQQVTQEFQATVGGTPGFFYNTATVDGENFDPVSTDPSAPVQVIAPHLALTITVDKASTAPGDTLTYSVIYSNTGDDVAQTVIILQSIPIHTSFAPGTIVATGVSILYSTDGGGSYSTSASTNVTDMQLQLLAPLHPGANGVFQYKVKVN